MMFLICLPAYPNVRTEPQSEIGRNRGKKTPATQSAAASRAPKPDPSAPRSAMSAFFSSSRSWLRQVDPHVPLACNMFIN